LSKPCPCSRAMPQTWSQDYDRQEDDDDHYDNDDADEEAEDSDSEGELLQEAALPVSGPPLPPSDEPAQDADEYLRRVQWERIHCQQIVTADVEEKPMRRKRAGLVGKDGSLVSKFLGPNMPQEFVPRQEWASACALAFQALRDRCRRSDRVGVGYDGKTDYPNGLSYDEWRVRISQGGGRPSEDMLAVQDVLSVQRLLVVVVDAVVAATDGDVDGDGDAAGADEAADGSAGAACVAFGPGSSLAEWTFAALAVVEEPLVDDVQYNLQRLRRSCVKVIAASAAALPAEISRLADAIVSGINQSRAEASLILAIVTDVFGQR